MENQSLTEQEAPKECLKVEYKVSMEDVIDFNLYHVAHSPMLQRSRLRFYLLPPLLYAIFGAMLSYSSHRLNGIVIFGLASVIWLLIAPTRWRNAIRKRVKRLMNEGQNPGLIGTHTLTITPEGLETVGNNGESRLKWSGVAKIVTSDTHLYIYLSATSALMIPKSAFASGAALERFVETARRYREVAAGLHPEEILTA